MSVKGGLEVNPEQTTVLVLLSGQNVSDKVVPVEEPATPENVQDVEYRGATVFLNPRGGRADRTGGRGRGCHFGRKLLGRGKGRGMKLLRRHRDDRSKSPRRNEIRNLSS